MIDAGPGPTYHRGLEWLYRNALKRERETLWGPGALCRLYIVGPAGYEMKLELKDGWNARRWNTVESDSEEWRLEIEESPDLPYEEMKRIAAVDLIGHDYSQRCKVSQVTKPVTAGHVWFLRLNPTGELL
jgi:hypothetical protein